MFPDEANFCQYQAKVHGITLNELAQVQAQAQASNGESLSHDQPPRRVACNSTKFQNPTHKRSPGSNIIINLVLAWFKVACSEQYYYTFVQRATRSIGIAKEIGHEETVQLWQKYHEKRAKEWEEYVMEKEALEQLMMEA